MSICVCRPEDPLHLVVPGLCPSEATHDLLFIEGCFGEETGGNRGDNPGGPRARRPKRAPLGRFQPLVRSPLARNPVLGAVATTSRVRVNWGLLFPRCLPSRLLPRGTVWGS